MVVSVASSRSTASSVSIQPKSRADATDSRYRPMLVGDVRWAAAGSGASWKLSGGRLLAPNVTKASKKRHVFRATRRKLCASVLASGRRPATRGDKLALSATAGETNQPPANGAAKGHVQCPHRLAP